MKMEGKKKKIFRAMAINQNVEQQMIQSHCVMTTASCICRMFNISRKHRGEMTSINHPRF
jgi:hypothetical protein